MTKESLQENYINCTKLLKYQKFWDYVQIVVHIVFTVCLVVAYVKAIGNGTDFVKSRFIPYSVWSAVFGFGTYGMIRSIIDIKAINKELKLFDDVHQSAIEALGATEREKASKSTEQDKTYGIDAFTERWGFKTEKWGLNGDINLMNVIQKRMDELHDINALMSEIRVTEESDSWPDGEYYVCVDNKTAKFSKSAMMAMYKDFTKAYCYDMYILIAIPASSVEAYIKEHI